MNTENQFKEGQEVWVKARIRSGIVFSDNTIAIRIRTANQDDNVYYCLCSEIRTTEQIWKDVITNDSKSDKFRVYIDDVRQGLNYYYIYAPDGTEAVLPKDCYSPREVIEICDAENAKIASQNAKPTTISKPETVTETPHFDEKTPHNAELTAQNAEPSEGAECWVKAEFVTTVSDDSRAVKFRDCEDNAHIIFMDEEDVRFTDPTHSTAIIELIEPDRTRPFRKGDKVQRRKELYGRDLRKTCPSLPFDEIFTIAEDEKNPWEVKIKWGDKTGQGGFIYFELVEPAPEEKFFIDDELAYASYQINYGTPNNHKFVAKLDTDFYTLEEARQECERLSQKESHE